MILIENLAFNSPSFICHLNVVSSLSVFLLDQPIFVPFESIYILFHPSCREVEMAHQVLSKDMAALVEAMRLAIQYANTTLHHEYTK